MSVISKKALVRLMPDWLRFLIYPKPDKRFPLSVPQPKRSLLDKIFGLYY